jgi:hypothetical protein
MAVVVEMVMVNMVGEVVLAMVVEMVMVTVVVEIVLAMVDVVDGSGSGHDWGYWLGCEEPRCRCRGDNCLACATSRNQE